MQLTFNVNKQTLNRSDDELPASGSKEYLTAKFTFSDDWNCTTKTAVFSRRPLVFNQILDDNGECKVPHDIIVAKGAVISVFGTDGTKRITTIPLFVRIDSSGYAEGSTPEPPTPTVYEQIIEKLDEVKSDVPDVPAWAMQPSKPSYTALEVNALPDTTSIPTKITDLTDNGNFIHKSGDETITGVKTFVDNVLAPNLIGGNTVYGGSILTNLDTITKNGFYTCYGTATGVPNSSYSWFVIHQNSNAGNVSATQRGTAYGDNSIVYERKKVNGIWKDWVLQVSRSEFDNVNSNLNNNTISTTGLMCSWGTIVDGGYSQVGKIVVVNIRVATTTSLVAGTTYNITGFPSANTALGGITVPISINKPTLMNYGNVTSGGRLDFRPNTGISSGEMLVFGATYVTT